MEKQNQKEINRAFIKQFNSISIKNICCDLGIEKDYGNIINGTASKSKIQKVRNEIEKRLKILNENR